MSFNNAGTARYRIELDTSDISSKLSGFQSSMTQSNFSLQNMNKPMGALNSNFQKLNGNFAAGQAPLSQFNQQAGACQTTFDKAGASIEKTGGRLKKVGEAFRGNKGLIFGFAGLASAAAEGAGMIGMYGDAVAANAEAQEKLQKVQADTTSSTQDIGKSRTRSS